MTEAQFVAFVKGHLRRASRFWKPISETLKKARVSRGYYLCNGCKETVTNSIIVDGKRKKNVFVDHRIPVVDPVTGFSGWDDFVNRLYCEEENLQVLCSSCHNEKTKQERLMKGANEQS
jgi:5-methylcytosine-specific restriction endonuclease McrA